MSITNKSELLIPKAKLIEYIKPDVISSLELEMKEAGVKHFSVLDIEWSDLGIIVHYVSDIDHQTTDLDENSS